MYVVVACPRCRRARIAEEGRKTAACGSCGRALQLRDLRVHHTGGALEEAQEAAGRLNARLAGREEEYVAATLLQAPAPPARHDSPLHHAAAAARKATGDAARADAVARALGEFDEQDLHEAFALAGLRDPERHLRRMLETQVVYEPRAGCYQAL